MLRESASVESMAVFNRKGTSSDKYGQIFSKNHRIKRTLEELRKILNKVLGSFVIDKKGDLISQDLPDETTGNIDIDYISKFIHQSLDVLSVTKPVERLTIDSENAKLTATAVDDKMLVVITEREVNVPLLKLLINRTIAKIKVESEKKEEPKKYSIDVGNICDLYDKLFRVVANMMTKKAGEKSAALFNEGTKEVKERYPRLFGNLKFGSAGRPDMIEIRKNATKTSKKEELTTALDEMLLSMLEVLEEKAGKKERQKALEQIQRLKGSHTGLLRSL